MLKKYRVDFYTEQMGYEPWIERVYIEAGSEEQVANIATAYCENNPYGKHLYASIGKVKN